MPARSLTIALLLLVGLGLRGAAAWGQPLWVDEAESALNAMTILERGLPVSEVMGLPIYENTLVRPWPGHPEYEFADSSYSDRGLAIYHGWLPLYSMAATFLATGLGPDDPRDRSSLGRGVGELRWRTLVPRLPSLGFSLLFLLLIHAAARELFDRGTAITALVGASLSSSLVWLGAQARYYAPTLALTAAALLLVARVVRRGGWRDALGCGVVLVLLFHTHVLSFAIATGVLGLALPWWWRHPGAPRKAAASGALLVVGCLPWMLATGWLDHLGEAPAARALIDPLAEVRRYIALRPHVAGACVVALAIMAWRTARLAGQRGRRETRALALLGAWLVLALGLFLAVMPAASFFLKRLSLVLLVPGSLLLARCLWLACQRVPRHPRLAAALGMVLLLGVSGRLRPSLPSMDDPTMEHFAPLTALAALDLPPDARLYATPNDHLVLTWYGGVPVQSIAPVRHGFLAACPAPIVIVERVHDLPRDDEPLGWLGLTEAAATTGEPLEPLAARALARRLQARVAREDLVARAARVEPPLAPLPAWQARAVEAQRAVLAARLAEHTAPSVRPPILRGAELTSWHDWWPHFFYRFVGPEERAARYAALVARAGAHLAPDGRWTLLVIPPDESPTG